MTERVPIPGARRARLFALAALLLAGAAAPILLDIVVGGYISFANIADPAAPAHRAPMGPAPDRPPGGIEGALSPRALSPGVLSPGVFPGAADIDGKALAAPLHRLSGQRFGLRAWRPL